MLEAAGSSNFRSFFTLNSDKRFCFTIKVWKVVVKRNLVTAIKRALILLARYLAKCISTKPAFDQFMKDCAKFREQNCETILGSKNSPEPGKLCEVTDIM